MIYFFIDAKVKGNIGLGVKGNLSLLSNPVINIKRKLHGDHNVIKTGL